MSPFGPFAVSSADLARVAPDVPVSAIYVTRAPDVSDAALRRIQRDLDLAEARLLGA